MRIGIIVDHPFEAPLGYSIRPRELAMHLAELGCEVHVFSPVDVDRKISNSLILHGTSSRKTHLIIRRLHRLLRKAYKSPLFAHYLYEGRTLNALAKRLADSLYSKIKDCDLDVLQGEKEIASMAAIFLGEHLRVPVVSDIHGLLVEEAIQYGFIKGEGKEYFEIRNFVSGILHNSDAVVVVSDCLKKYLVESFDCDRESFFTVPNAGVFRGIVRPSRSTPRNVVYAGILEPWERVDLAVESMFHVSKVNGEARLSIAGEGSVKNDLLKIVRRLNLTNHVSFVGTVPYDKVSDFLVQGDVAVLPSTVDIVRKVACPIKLFDYLAVGLPVVTVNGLWWSDFIKLNNVGLVTGTDPRDFADAINDLLSNPDKINTMSESASRLVREKYNWMEMAKKLLGIYEKIL
jgi:glycosyltransferase involved in cell wall biosynthesis